MRIIPVLDLKGGEVVRAERGQRHRYRPIATPLSSSADALEVAMGLRRLHPFPTFYIADLDAIEGRAPDVAMLARLRTMADPPELWVDAGINDEAALAEAFAEPSVFPVLGSESQRDERLLERHRDHPRVILSLDFFGDGFRGPPALLERPELWPQRVIVMTLGRVGSAAGPDFERLAEIKARAGDRAVVAAGGVRDAGDVRALRSMGVAAALVATSLHDGTLTAAELGSFGD